MPAHVFTFLRFVGRRANFDEDGLIRVICLENLFELRDGRLVFVELF